MDLSNHWVKWVVVEFFLLMMMQLFDSFAYLYVPHWLYVMTYGMYIMQLVISLMLLAFYTWGHMRSRRTK